MVITLPTAENARLPNWGIDERIKALPLKSLSEVQVEKLLKAAGANFDYGLTTWIIGQAGGNPGILIAATRLGDDLRKDAMNFSENIAKAFEAKTRRELGDRAIDILQPLSLLSSVGIRGRVSGEAIAICAQFGNGIEVNAI